MGPPEDSPPSSPAGRLLALACFFISGACGLAYEIVWVRQLTLIAGATAPAVSIVLAVFMGGLALGARAFGKLADRVRSPLKLYAWLELGIALYGLLQPALLASAGSVYVSLVRQADVHGPIMFGARLTVAAAVLLLPCVLMGGTLPVLARFVGRSQERFGLDLGALYAVNLAGAVAGSLVTAFVLVRALGLKGTIAAAVLGNLLVGGVALVVSARSRASDEAESPAPRITPSAGGQAKGLRAALWILMGLSGFVTMGYQVTWTRVLSFGFDHTVYAFTMVLVTFLLGLALGSLVFASLDRRVGRLRLLFVAQVLGGVSALLLTPLAVVLRLPQILEVLTPRLGYSGWVQTFSLWLVASAVMLLPTVLMGIVFPLVARLLADDQAHVGGSLGRAYWVNTVGAIIGSLITGFVLIPAWSLKYSLLALAAAQIAGGLLLWPWLQFSGRQRVGAAVVCGLALPLTLAGFLKSLPGAAPFDPLDTSRGSATLRASRDGAVASVSVTEFRSGRRDLRINGFVATTDDEGGGYMPMMSHLPMLVHQAPRRVLVICFGTGATAGAVLLHPQARVDVVEINPAVLEFAPWFEHANRGVTRDPRARVIVDDGRNHLLTTRETYDVITSEPMPPKHAGVVSLYSREYYLLARQRLAPGGLLVQWLPFHLLERQDTRDILRTVREVFPETTLWLHSDTGLIVARAEGPVTMDWNRLQEAWREPALAADLERLGVPDPESFVGLFRAGSANVARLAEGGRVVSDDLPWLEFHAPRLMMREMVGSFSVLLAEAQAAIYPLRAREPLPLAGAPTWKVLELGARLELQTVGDQADLEMNLGRPARAREGYERGLRQSSPASRGRFLLGLARAVNSLGEPGEARRRLAELMALEPDNADALTLLRKLGPGPG